MSRSRRKAPIRKSNRGNLKRWRTEVNRSLRRHNRVRIHIGAEEFLDLDDVSDLWTSPADGYWAAWDYWSERQKESPWHFHWVNPERGEELERKWAARKERQKWKLFNK